jgi:hypothetical protein
MQKDVLFDEKKLPDVLGVRRDEIMKVRRELDEGVHWVREKNGRAPKLWKVQWTEVGMVELRKRFGMEEEVAKEIEEKVKEVKAGGGGVVKAKYRNPRLIGVEVGGKVESVLVRDSRNFVLGMEVPLRRDAGRWVAAKHPRFGGKW